MAGIFGTDGVRARINTGPMRAEAVVRLALAAGRWFADQSGVHSFRYSGDRAAGRRGQRLWVGYRRRWCD